MKIRIFHLFIIYILCACIPLLVTEKVPVELIGIWETTFPEYEEAQIEITATTISFINGPDHRDTNRVTRFENKMHYGRQLYIIDYKNDEGAEYSLPLYYSAVAGNNPMLRFKNQEQIIWRKST